MINLRTDIDNWMPVTVSRIYEVFSEIPIRWCIAGGWALDLHLGNKSRQHSDIDVIVIREDQLAAYQSLKRDWTLYKAKEGKLMIWEEGEFLKSTNDVWVSKNNNSPWAFQIMLIDIEESYWIYKREKSIKRAINEIFLRTPEGIPYLKPEVQLLYKAGSSQVREKDYNDFQTILPILSLQEKEWLKVSLKQQFPGGHAWIKYLN
ncbi:nucleotidyltransferase domain-containing protein [Brevibacillus laterosporus]|uniref:nucleotidyltransferase domain-containing protein n=1 Tax=Brevibacillus laterosporus TaxID=1465 RepID=UPI0035A698D8